MIHAYNNQDLEIIQTKLAEMFELAVLYENISIDDFTSIFTSSEVCTAFENDDFIYVHGKSSNELLALILRTEPKYVEQNDYATPEYWVGHVLAYAQWYLNIPYKTLISIFPCSKLINEYFPYHEMDISKSIELFTKRIPIVSKLKEFRSLKNLSQTELSNLSGVPVRAIKAYEQGKSDISKAQADTLYYLSKTLNCTIEDLIL